MAKAINTNFDQAMEEDVLLEPIDGKEPAVATTLKNSENIFKSFMYIKKMYSGGLSSARVLSMGSVDNTEFETIAIPDKAVDMRVSNISSSEASIKINGGEYKLQAGEIIEIPVIHPNSSVVPAVSGDLVELKGKISYILYIKSQV